MAIEFVVFIVCFALAAGLMFIALPSSAGHVRPFLATEFRQAGYTLVIMVFAIVGVVYGIDALALLFG